MHLIRWRPVRVKKRERQECESIESNTRQELSFVRFIPQKAIILFALLMLCDQSIAANSNNTSTSDPNFDSTRLFAWQASASDYFADTEVRDLARAASDGDTAGVGRLIANGVGVNSRGKGGVTPLNWALARQSKDGVLCLLQHGANPNLQMDDGTSAVSYAAMHEDIWYLKTVLEHGGDPNLENKIRSFTPICYSITSSDVAKPRLEQVKLLIRAGANLNWQDRNGETPLSVAADANRYDMVYLMLEAGADPTIKSTWDTTIVTEINTIQTDPNSDLYRWRAKVIALLKAKEIDVEHGR
jgi:ankyrin repeat protein